MSLLLPKTIKVEAYLSITISHSWPPISFAKMASNSYSSLTSAADSPGSASHPGSLTALIDALPSLPLPESVSAVTALLPALTPTHISPTTGERVITHAAQSGTDDLTRLARSFLTLGWRCTDEGAPLATRLAHYDAFPHFRRLYAVSEEQRLAAPKEVKELVEAREFPPGSGCSCCRGEPVVVMGEEGDVADRQNVALHFEEGLFVDLFGTDAPFLGSINKSQMASREMVAEALEREERRAIENVGLNAVVEQTKSNL